MKYSQACLVKTKLTWEVGCQADRPSVSDQNRCPKKNNTIFRTDLIALDRLPDLSAHRFLCFSSIFLRFSYSYVRQTKLSSSLVNFWAHNKIVLIDWLIDWWLLHTSMQCKMLCERKCVNHCTLYIVQCSCWDSNHITSPYRLSFYYYLLIIIVNAYVGWRVIEGPRMSWTQFPVLCLRHLKQ